MTHEEMLAVVYKRVLLICNDSLTLSCQLLESVPDRLIFNLQQLLNLRQYRKVLEYLIHIDSERRRQE